jgi:hypothetical protein
MRPIQDFAPVEGGETVVTVVAVAGSLLAYAFLTRVYRTPPVWAAVTGVLISWVPVQVLAAVLEQREMWLPGQHSAVFFWGDLVALPSIAVAFAVIRRLSTRDSAVRGSEGRGEDGLADARGPTPLADRWWWRTLVFGAALAISYWYHSMQLDTWPWNGVHSPSKAWHDFFVYPVFLYFLASQLPYLWQTSWRTHRIAMPALTSLAVAGVLAWFALGFLYDPAHVLDHIPLLPIA